MKAVYKRTQNRLKKHTRTYPLISDRQRFRRRWRSVVFRRRLGGRFGRWRQRRLRQWVQRQPFEQSQRLTVPVPIHGHPSRLRWQRTTAWVPPCPSGKVWVQTATPHAVIVVSVAVELHHFPSGCLPHRNRHLVFSLRVQLLSTQVLEEFNDTWRLKIKKDYYKKNTAQNTPRALETNLGNHLS